LKGKNPNVESLLEARDNVLKAESYKFTEENIRRVLADEKSGQIASELENLLERLDAKINSFSNQRQLNTVIAESLAIVAKER